MPGLEEVEEEIASDSETDEICDEECSDVGDLEDEDFLVQKYYGELSSEKLEHIEQLLEEEDSQQEKGCG